MTDHTMALNEYFKIGRSACEISRNKRFKVMDLSSGVYYKTFFVIHTTVGRPKINLPNSNVDSVLKHNNTNFNLHSSNNAS